LNPSNSNHKKLSITNPSSLPNTSGATLKSSKDPGRFFPNGQVSSLPSSKKGSNLIIKTGAFVRIVNIHTDLWESNSEFLTLAIPQAPHLRI
jgi:hypothetical protein